MKLGKLKLDWPQATLASVAIAAFVAVYLLAPESRDAIHEGIAYAWAVAATFLGPLLRKDTEDDE